MENRWRALKISIQEKIEEIMLIKNEADLDTFRKMYGIEGKIEKEY